MKIFISYASEDHEIAERVHLALTGENHTTFFDRDDLPAADSFHDRIRSAIRDSDAMVFLISPHSVAKGSYALTELKYARERWPHPKGHVLPVLFGQIELEDVPNYLKAVVVLEPEGDIVAEIVDAVAALPRNREAWVRTLVQKVRGHPVRAGIGLGLMAAAIVGVVAFRDCSSAPGVRLKQATLKNQRITPEIITVGPDDGRFPTKPGQVIGRCLARDLPSGARLTMENLRPCPN